MRKIIQGRAYDTRTAEQLAEHAFGHPGEDGHYVETLCRTRKGAFFLACAGGARSPYGRVVRPEVSKGGDEILPLTEIEAMRWLENHDETTVIERLFGSRPEAGDEMELLWTRVPAATKAAVLRAAFEASSSVEDWIAKAIKRHLGH